MAQDWDAGGEERNQGANSVCLGQRTEEGTGGLEHNSGVWLFREEGRRRGLGEEPPWQEEEGPWESGKGAGEVPVIPGTRREGAWASCTGAGRPLRLGDRERVTQASPEKMG